MLQSGHDFGDLEFDDLRISQKQNVEELQKEMAHVFKKQLDLERKLERSKVDLSLRTDFNLIDAFRVFDQEGKGWVSATEIKEGLTHFNVFIQPEDISFFMKRYDKDEDGRLRYSEFCDAFLPTD